MRNVVYLDASILTRDLGNPIASAMWVHGDRVAAIGGEEQVLAAAGSTADIVSLGGQTVLPGLIDTHCHLMWFAYLFAGADCSPQSAPNIAAIKGLMAETEPGGDGWSTGSGFAEYELDELRPPTRFDLDEAVPDRPCVLYHTSMHVCVVNSIGLRELGLSDSSEDPPLGVYGRDADGRLDGLLYEQPVFDLMDANMKRHLASIGPERRALLIERACLHLASLGITSCTDASTSASSFSTLRHTERSGHLPIRVTCMFTFPEATWLLDAAMTTGFGTHHVRIGAIKVWADGGMSSRTAAVDEPYLDPPGETGILLHDRDALASMIEKCDTAGFQVAIHAHGELAIRVVLEALASSSAPGNPLRHRIEHGGAFRPQLREIAASQNVHVVTQPAFLSQLGDGFIGAFGPERSDYLYPIRSLSECGLVVAGSSDSPVCAVSPFLAMRDAVLRTTKRGAAVAAGEAISSSDALDLYTRNAAFVGWADEDVGTLEVGKLADFIVVDRDPLTVPPETLPDTTVRSTVVGGTVVFDDGLLSAQVSR